MHFLRNSPGGPESGIESRLRRAGAKTYLIMSGTNTPGTYGELDHRFDSWPAPVIAPASGWIGKLPARSLIEGGYQFTKPDLKHGADALLYLGPRDSLISVSMTRAQLAGTPYGAEIVRRLKIHMILQSDAVFADALFPEKEENPQFPAW